MAMNETYIFECVCGTRVVSESRIATCSKCSRILDGTAWGAEPTEVG